MGKNPLVTLCSDAPVSTKPSSVSSVTIHYNWKFWAFVILCKVAPLQWSIVRHFCWIFTSFHLWPEKAKNHQLFPLPYTNILLYIVTYFTVPIPHLLKKLASHVLQNMFVITCTSLQFAPVSHIDPELCSQKTVESGTSWWVHTTVFPLSFRSKNAVY